MSTKKQPDSLKRISSSAGLPAPPLEELPKPDLVSLLTDQKHIKKNKRPKIQEIKNDLNLIEYYIPLINNELKYYIKQSSGIRNYDVLTVNRFKLRINQLKNEYKRFVRTLVELDPSKIHVYTPIDTDVDYKYARKRKITIVDNNKQEETQSNSLVDYNTSSD